jgi:hypothetical protein
MNGNTDTNGNTNGNVVAVAVAITDKLNDIVIIVLSNKTDASEIFTAWDITKQAREEYPTMNIPHDDVKDMVVSSFRSDFCDDYDRECMDLTISAKAFVYFPKGESPYDHPMVAQPVTPTPTTTPTRTSDPNTDLTVEKRLNIDKSLLSELGLVPGKLVNVDTDGGIMSLTMTTDPAGDTLVVNADGRLRLSSRMLTKAFGRLPTKYDISFNNDDFTIEIKAL